MGVSEGGRVGGGDREEEEEGEGTDALREENAAELEVPDYLVKEGLEGACPGRGELGAVIDTLRAYGLKG